MPEQGLHPHQRGHGADEEVPSEVQTNDNPEAMTEEELENCQEQVAFGAINEVFAEWDAHEAEIFLVWLVANRGIAQRPDVPLTDVADELAELVWQLVTTHGYDASKVSG